MNDEIINFELPAERSSIIKVIGVGGGGGNAVNYMYRLGIKDVNFVVCNTDSQALRNSPVGVKIQLGTTLTEGRGAGNNPEIGRKAAMENMDEIQSILASNTKMIFITAGMGGGTGTGASPVIAKAAREMDILTVAIVTIPFPFEGPLRLDQAIKGINELRQYVDSLLVINNGRLREIYGDLRISDAFARADDVLATAAKGIAEIITVPGYVNVDFADVHTVMANSGAAIMGSAQASGPERAITAIRQALNSPLLNNNDIKGAKNVLLNITSGTDEVTMDEVGIITDFVTSSVTKKTNIIWGTCNDPSLGDRISVTIIATGFEAGTAIPELYSRSGRTTIRVPVTDGKNNANPVGPAFEVTRPAGDDSGDDMIKITDRTVEHGAQQYDLFGQLNIDLSSDQMKNRNKASDSASGQLEKASTSRQETILKPDQPEDIDALENEPAFVRKKLQISAKKYSRDNQISRFTIADEGSNGIVLRPDNPYLHDNVD
ncbi:MAG TPA: cell division protein FtsZ [Bacteroidales bacterium]|nr:cell division protein FtsZ [Bacteroidales bacterium]